MASVYPSVLKRIGRVGLEVGGCVGIWAYADSLEVEEPPQHDLQGRLSNARSHQYYLQEKSMFAEYRLMYNKITKRCEEEVKAVIKSKSITEADMNEFYDNLAVDNIRTVPPPAWIPLAANALPAEFMQQFATVTPEEGAGLTSYMSDGLKHSTVTKLLNLMALKSKNEENLDNHFSYYFDILGLGQEAVKGARMSSEVAQKMECIRALAKVGMTAMLLMATRYGIYKDWLVFDKPTIPNVLKSKNMLSFLVFSLVLLTMRRVRTDVSEVLAAEPLSRYFADSIIQDDLAASEERGEPGCVSAEAMDLTKWLMVESNTAGPVPLGGTQKEPINMRNAAIYAIIKPISELLVFSAMLPLSLRHYVGSKVAIILPVLACSIYKGYQKNYDLFCVSRELPMLEAFISNMFTSLCSTVLHMSTGSMLFPLTFLYMAHVEEVAAWFRNCDHLLRPNWAFIRDVRFFLENLTYYKCLAFQRGRSPPTEEMRNFAEAMAEIYSTDYYSETKSKKMSAKDLEAVTVGLEYYFEKHHAIAKDKGPFRLAYLALHGLFHDPRNERVDDSLPPDIQKMICEDNLAHQKELNQVYFDTKTDFLNRLAGPKGLDMDGFTAYLEFALEDYAKKAGPVNLMDVSKTLSQWEESISHLDEFLDLTQANYEVILACDRDAYSRYDQALYDRLEIHLGGRYKATEVERRLHMAEVNIAVSSVRMWHVSNFLTSQGLSPARYSELHLRYSARHQEVKDLNSQWAAYFKSDKYRIKNLELLSQKGHSRYFMKLLEEKFQLKVSLNESSEGKGKSNSQ